MGSSCGGYGGYEEYWGIWRVKGHVLRDRQTDGAGWELDLFPILCQPFPPFPSMSCRIKLLHEDASHTRPPWGAVLMTLTDWFSTLCTGSSWAAGTVGPEQVVIWCIAQLIWS